MNAKPKPKPTFVQDLPESPAITAEVRERLVREAREWRAGVAEQVAQIEAVTSEDLRIRAR